MMVGEYIPIAGDDDSGAESGSKSLGLSGTRIRGGCVEKLPKCRIVGIRKLLRSSHTLLRMYCHDSRRNLGHDGGVGDGGFRYRVILSAVDCRNWRRPARRCEHRWLDSFFRARGKYE